MKLSVHIIDKKGMKVGEFVDVIAHSCLDMPSTWVQIIPKLITNSVFPT